MGLGTVPGEADLLGGTQGYKFIQASRQSG